MQLRFTVLPSLLLALALAFTQTASAQGLGLSVGANFNDLSDIDTGSSEATFDNASGWHLHLWVDLPAGPVAVRPGIRYMDAGAIFQNDDFAIPDEDEAVSLLEIPIDLRYRFTVPIVTPYILAGPVLRFPTGNDDDQDRLQSFSVAGGLGVGAELGFAGFRLFPELKYTFGITRFTEEEYQIGNVTFEADEAQHLNAIMLSLGVGL